MGKVQFQETFNLLDCFGLKNLDYFLCQINSKVLRNLLNYFILDK